MLKMNDDLEGALKHYMKLLDEGAYFEAHEVLEEAWHPLRIRKDYLANLVKGLINGAIAFEHIKRNRVNAHYKAQRVFTAYEKHKNLCIDTILYYNLFKDACKKIENLKEIHFKI